MVGVAKLIQMSRKLISSGNINIKNALGESARVYLTIPAGGRGKVSLTVQERLIEADAMSDDKNDLVTGTMVRVVDIRSGILVVEKD
ncbi:MAG: NfeD-like [Oscillospiraceae bacterium]|jgi:hypothetical protein|nr:NfeD-like [Oscillospiraceae bacterium]